MVWTMHLEPFADASTRLSRTLVSYNSLASLIFGVQARGLCGAILHTRADASYSTVLCTVLDVVSEPRNH